MQADVEDKSGNLIAGFPTVHRAAEFLRWLADCAPNALLDVRVITHDSEGMPSEHDPRRLL